MNAFINVVWYMYAYRHAYIHQTIALSEFRRVFLGVALLSESLI